MAMRADKRQVPNGRIEVTRDGARRLGRGKEAIGVEMAGLGHGGGCAMFDRRFQYLPYKMQLDRV
ncbi:hypothetical protein D3C73_1533110 [compost metagenome]